MIAPGLEGKVVIVTGGRSGIGRATALRFAEAGCRVAVWDLTPADNGLGREMGALGGEYLYQEVDVTRPADVHVAVNAVMSRWSSINVLVNNAGITRDALLVKWQAGQVLAEMSDEAFDQVIDVNLRAVFACTRAVVPHMIVNGGGVVLNASSIVGVEGNVGQTNYAAAKAAVIAMTRTWARELGRHRIRVNALAPGLIATDMVRTVPEKIKERWVASTPLGRLGDPREVAEAYVWLASDAAAFIHGAVLAVDGGLVVGA